MEASPDMTIGDFKRQLQELQEDESMKEVTIVEVLMGERKLTDDEETLMQAGFSQDVVLQVVFTAARRCAVCFCTIALHDLKTSQNSWVMKVTWMTLALVVEFVSIYVV